VLLDDALSVFGALPSALPGVPAEEASAAESL
jgi:hypothetical protein